MILHVITGLRRGGAEILLLNLLSIAKTSDFRYQVMAIGTEFPLEKEFRDRNIDLTLVRFRKNLFSFLPGLVFMILFVRKNKIKILHAHMFHSLIIGILLKLIFPYLKVVFTSHNVHFGNGQNNSRSYFRSLFIYLTKPFRTADVLFTNSDDNKYTRKKFIIPNGVVIYKKTDVKKFEKFTFVSVGRLEYQKNHRAIIEIAKNLLGMGLQFELIIVGEGILRNDLQDLINNLGLQDFVTLYGQSKDVNSILQKSHCFLMPSLWEGMPISILEAGMAKLPIISTAVGSIPEILNSDCGIVTNLNDFESKMKWALINYNSLKKYGENLRKKIVKDYSIDRTLERHESLYNLVLNS
jgi:glycosyltransferase involved in cell wall biosynthesis